LKVEKQREFTLTNSTHGPIMMSIILPIYKLITIIPKNKTLT